MIPQCRSADIVPCANPEDPTKLDSSGPRTWRDLFKELPLELQLSVWRYAIGGPRVHRLRYQTRRGKTDVSPSETLPRSTQAARSILGVSKAVREKALRMLADTIKFSAGGVLRLDTERDVVSLVQISQQRMVETEGIDLPSLRCIRNIGIEVRGVDFIRDFSRFEFDYLAKFLLRFDNPKILYLITMPLPGDSDTVVFFSDDESGAEEGDTISSGSSEAPAGAIKLASSDLPRSAGELLRDENGLSVWYCRASASMSANWTYMDGSELTHFGEMLQWHDEIAPHLGGVDVQVMIHFREGVEPPEF